MDGREALWQTLPGRRRAHVCIRDTGPRHPSDRRRHEDAGRPPSRLPKGCCGGGRPRHRAIRRSAGADRHPVRQFQRQPRGARRRPQRALDGGQVPARRRQERRHPRQLGRRVRRTDTRGAARVPAGAAPRAGHRPARPRRASALSRQPSRRPRLRRAPDEAAGAGQLRAGDLLCRARLPLHRRGWHEPIRPLSLRAAGRRGLPLP